MATSYSLWHTRVIQFIICFSNTHVTGSLLSADSESLLRDTSNFVTKNELGHLFPAIYGKNLLPSNGPVLLKVVIPLDGDVSHITPRCYRESAMLEVNWFGLLQILKNVSKRFDIVLR